MTSQKLPFSTITKTMKRDLIAYLKTQRRYIRSTDIIDGFCEKYPKYLSGIPSRRGKTGVLGHALAALLPVRTRTSCVASLFDNVYSADCANGDNRGSL